MYDYFLLLMCTDTEFVDIADLLRNNHERLQRIDQLMEMLGTLPVRYQPMAFNNFIKFYVLSFYSF